MMMMISAVCLFAAAAGASGVSGVQTRAVAPYDRGEEAGPVPVGGLQRGRGPQSAQVLVRTPQSPRREGTSPPVPPVPPAGGSS